MQSIRTLVTALFVVLCATPAIAADYSIKPFFGDYVGRSISDQSVGLSERDLNVSIKPQGENGFTVDWTTLSRKADGRIKRKSYSIDFYPTPRASVYASAMRSNKFGRRVPLDPLQGEPYIWARIHGETLTVFALIVANDGGYELQTYDRTLTDFGLSLRFSRIRNGQQLKVIEANLVRLDG